MKINVKILMVILSIICCVNAAGCMSLPKNYTGDLRPIYPKLGSTMMKYYQVIDTLQPELQWEDSKPGGHTYDVCVWETSSNVTDESFVPFTYRNWGDQVYYVQGISDTHHKINEQLKPNTCYHWSVRTRNGMSVSDWAAFSQTMVGIVIGYEGNIPYGFITPEK